MRWLYYLPHLWEDNEGNLIEKTSWEDVYLMPDGPTVTQSIWLTVEGYQAEDEKPYPDFDFIDEKTWFDEGEFAIFECQGYLIRSDVCDMIILPRTFSKEELYGWVKVYLRDEGYECTDLVEAPFERFVGTNQHVCGLSHAAEILEEYRKDPEKHFISVDLDEILGEKK
jgi:hypothetical protein